MSFAELVGLVYEAGIEPERWPVAIKALAGHFRARSMILFSTPVAPETFTFIAEHGTDPEWEALYNRHYTTADVNPAGIAYRRQPVGQANADWMILPTEELRRSPFYNEWACPQGYQHFAGMITEMGPGKIGGFMFARSGRHGRVEEQEVGFLRGLAPHICRAVSMSRRIGAMKGRLQLFEALLDFTSEAIIVIDAEGRVIEANERARALVEAGDGIMLRGGRVAAIGPEFTEALLARVAALLAGDLGALAPFALPRRHKQHPLVVSLAMLPDDVAGTWVRRPAAALFIADPEAPPPDMVESLTRIYGLTKAEAVVVDLVARHGPSISEAAERLGVAAETVRTHLKRAYDKTGVSRRSELTRLALQTVAALPQGATRFRQ